MENKIKTTINSSMHVTNTHTYTLLEGIMIPCRRALAILPLNLYHTHTHKYNHFNVLGQNTPARHSTHRSAMHEYHPKVKAYDIIGSNTTKIPWRRFWEWRSLMTSASETSIAHEQPQASRYGAFLLVASVFCPDSFGLGLRFPNLCNAPDFLWRSLSRSRDACAANHQR